MTFLSSRLFRKLFLSFFAVAFGISALVGLGAERAYRAHVSSEIEGRLSSAAALLAAEFRKGVFHRAEGRLNRLIRQMGKVTGNRITLIAPDGKVMADSDELPKRMDNHRDRPEIVQAIGDGKGRSERFSATMNREMMYFAEAIYSQEQLLGVVRVSLFRDRVLEGVAATRRVLVWSLLIALFLSLAASIWIARRVADPIVQLERVVGRIQEGDFEVQVDKVLPDELGNLGGAINKMSAELRYLERARQDFVVNASHELKTPLTVIKGYVDTLREEGVDQETRDRFLDQLSSNVDRLARMADDLLDLSRIQSRVRISSLQNLVVQEQVLEAVERYRGIVEKRSLQWVTDICDEKLTIRSNRDALSRILDNLLDNAVKYTKEGAVSVRLRRDEGRALVEIEDTGLGIPEEDRERVFERFYRVEKGRSMKAGGTGLGLAIVKHLALQVGATISLESEVGRGSRFTISLPIS